MQEPWGWLLFGEGRPRHRSYDRVLLGAGGTKAFVAPSRVDNRFGVVHPSAARGVKLPRFIKFRRFPGLRTRPVPIRTIYSASTSSAEAPFPGGGASAVPRVHIPCLQRIAPEWSAR